MFYCLDINRYKSYIYDSSDCTYGEVDTRLINKYNDLFCCRQKYDTRFIWSELIGVGKGVIVSTEDVCALITHTVLYYWYKGVEYNFFLMPICGKMFIRYYTNKIYKDNVAYEFYMGDINSIDYYFIPLRDGDILIHNAVYTSDMRTFTVREEWGEPCTRGRFNKNLLLLNLDISQMR